ncbi:gamma-glutamyltransferase [Bradyrhizobium sp. WYCCWR 13023]|uniref:Glutathione hydrolase proenzyme n=1 Tax=Bradyrhizobium zhengyangense TaxID=2911009 RepID=A0A9X1U8R0_9BRAD|nr:gamma-glutamyltransferase [Bradyrhizobium zhengyangense]MCG2626218.1 gamma-glutamyltransferase [Bradyrhizobium zhengyangense]MCG2644771.1 gamma-glutamyltransferase [Bradyrhizobium zhengyangense]MCG2668224.1 gamma-glutamyltransferase [Bradyrhizobium zhengyangense]
MSWGQRDFMVPGRSLAVGDRGMVAASHPAVTLAAVDILRSGGNAVDAAIAAIALQGVIDPHMTGIGGDCFAIYAPASGKPVAINGSGRAPAKAEPGWFRQLGLMSIPDDSPHAVTIPGAVDAWCRLSADHGSKGLDEVFAPAIKAAESGFVVTPRAALDWARYANRIERHQTGAPVYLPGGTAPVVGGKLSHPALGATLRRIAREGRAAFYEGAVADEIVSILKALGGLMEADDLATARSDYVTPISADYRDHQIWQCPPNGQGVAALLIARILAGYDMTDTTLGEADRIHLLAEATKAAYRQRDALLADPSFRPFDIDALLSERSVATLRSRISRERASAPTDFDMPVHRDTAYVAVADRDGNMVSLINSLFFAFGSGIYAPRSGVLLQNRGSGFSLIDGHPNVIAPGKRPFHTIIPGLLAKHDRPVMAFGVMGGQYQATGHLQILSGMLDRGMDIQQSSDAPRSFAFDGAVTLEPTIPGAVADDLIGRGHRVVWADEPLGGYQAVHVDTSRGVMFGASDHRKDGIALAA